MALAVDHPGQSLCLVRSSWRREAKSARSALAVPGSDAKRAAHIARPSSIPDMSRASTPAVRSASDEERDRPSSMRLVKLLDRVGEVVPESGLDQIGVRLAVDEEA